MLHQKRNNRPAVMLKNKLGCVVILEPVVEWYFSGLCEIEHVMIS